ncbi:MAG TPA: phosphate transport system regulatory protein PhoU [Phycisphaerales bacterium]|nr:phosphate transport system regulatory protein PhoU [Phycisphaerales bacterium]|tara:strand:- start:39004 stop:39699 length:696 start_codon:yes stop_codon:yes gene_type:complete
MSIHFRRQTEKLKKMVLTLGGMVEQALRDAINSLDQRDPELAQRVIRGDRQINSTEVEIEEECLATLALHQPVAFDLRYLIAILKMCNDLERIGDLAVNVAEQAKFLCSEEEIMHVPYDLTAMASRAQMMLKNALDALVNVDTTLAEGVRAADRQVDAIYREMFELIEAAMRENPHQLTQLIHYLQIGRQIERLADHAVNIAEDVLYLSNGEFFKKNAGDENDTIGRIGHA